MTEGAIWSKSLSKNKNASLLWRGHDNTTKFSRYGGPACQKIPGLSTRIPVPTRINNMGAAFRTLCRPSIPPFGDLKTGFDYAAMVPKSLWDFV